MFSEYGINRLTIGGQRIVPRYLHLLCNGTMISACEECHNYLQCVGDNFENCKGLLIKALLNSNAMKNMGKQVLDFSPLTFVGRGNAGIHSKYSYGYGPLNNDLDLSTSAVEHSKARYRLSGKLAAKTRAYKKEHCSQCVMNCRHVRSGPDRLISEKFLGEVYDTYLNILFKDASLSRELRYCRWFSSGKDSQLSDRETKFISKVFQSCETIRGPILLRPLYKGYFIMELSNYASNSIVLSSRMAHKIFSRNEANTTFINNHRDKIVFSCSILNGVLNDYYGYRFRVINPTDLKTISHCSLRKLIISGNDWISSRQAFIPGTNIRVFDCGVARTDRQILRITKRAAKDDLNCRKGIVNVVESRLRIDNPCLYCSTSEFPEQTPYARRILSMSELSSIVKECAK